MFNFITQPIVSRRSLLIGAGLAPVLAACTGPASTTIATVATNLPTYAQDVSNIAVALGKYVATLPGTLMAKLQPYIAKIAAAADEVVSAAQSNQSVANFISVFTGGFGDLLGAVGGQSALGGLGTFGTILAMGLKLLPAILTVAGVVLAAVPSPAAAADVIAARAYIAQLAKA